MHYPKITFIPLDDRPCNYSWADELLSNLGINLILPDTEWLGSYHSPGSPEELYDFAMDNLSQESILIVSADMFIYGGLWASRENKLELDLALSRVGKLFEAKEKFPAAWFYLCSTLLRSVPEVDIDVRKRNFDINYTLVEMAKLSNVDLIALSKDDNNPIGPQATEGEALKKLAEILVLAEHFELVNGADEMSLCVTARSIARFYNVKPKVHIFNPLNTLKKVSLYEDQTIEEVLKKHINLCGAELVNNIQDADVVIILNIFQNEQIDLYKTNHEINLANSHLIIKDVEQIMAQKKLVTLADIAFVNGGDPGLILPIIKWAKSEYFVGYSGWNTTANTCGSALAQAIINFVGIKKEIFNQSSKEKFITNRLLEDALYQSIIRRKLVNKLKEEQLDANNLGEHQEKIEEYVNEKINEELNKLGVDKNVSAAFPWPRIFEIDIEAN